MTTENSTVGPRLLNFYNKLKRRGNWMIIGGMIALFLFGLISNQLQPQPEPDYSKVGVHLLLDDGRGSWPIELWPEHMDYAAQMVGDGGYVVQLIRSDDLDIERWNTFMQLCAERNLQPIIRLATTFDHEANQWTAPPIDTDGSYKEIAANYASFIGALEWPTDQHYVILLNEPNRGSEWGGKPDASAYARFLVETTAAIRNADANAQILNAAFDLYAPDTGSQPFSDGFYYVDAETFMNRMVDAVPDVFDHIDVWNTHPYPQGAFREPPWFQTYIVDRLNDAAPARTKPPTGIVNRGINGYSWELWKLEAMGFNVDDLKVMITETGWRHAESVDENSLDAGEGYPDAETAAMYLDLAMRGNIAGYPNVRTLGFEPWLTEDQVIMVAPFALNGVPWEWGHTNLLEVDADGNITGTSPSFALLAGYSAEH